MWRVTKEGTSAGLGGISHVYQSFTKDHKKINVIEIMIVSSFQEVYTGYIISNPDNSEGILDYVNGDDLDVLKFKCLLKANEMGWDLDITDLDTSDEVIDFQYAK